MKMEREGFMTVRRALIALSFVAAAAVGAGVALCWLIDVIDRAEEAMAE